MRESMKLPSRPSASLKLKCLRRFDDVWRWQREESEEESDRSEGGREREEGNIFRNRNRIMEVRG